MTTPADILRSYIESPFAKAKADVVLLGVPEHDGQDVEDRRRQIAEEHRDLVEYRLVDLNTLVELHERVTELGVELRRYFDALTAAANDPVTFAADLARAKRLLDAARVDSGLDDIAARSAIPVTPIPDPGR